jgi:hypothetical protein
MFAFSVFPIILFMLRFHLLSIDQVKLATRNNGQAKRSLILYSPFAYSFRLRIVLTTDACVENILSSRLLALSAKTVNSARKPPAFPCGGCGARYVRLSCKCNRHTFSKL